MTYLSGLMLGASLANMARQMILGTGGHSAEGRMLHGPGGLFAAPERPRGTSSHALAHTAERCRRLFFPVFMLHRDAAATVRRI